LDKYSKSIDKVAGPNFLYRYYLFNLPLLSPIKALLGYIFDVETFFK